MVYTESEELIRANRLIQEGKFEEALQLIILFEEKEGLSQLEKISCYNLKSSLYYNMRRMEESCKYAEKAYKASQGQGPSLKLLDIYSQQIRANTHNHKFEEAHELIVKCEDILKVLIQEPSIKLMKRKADLLWNKSNLLIHAQSEYEKALKYSKRALVMREEINSRLGVVNSLNQIKEIYHVKGDFDKALEFTERILSKAKEIDYKIMIIFAYVTIGVIHADRGELKYAGEQYNKALQFARDLDYDYGIAAISNNLGIVYKELGDLDKAQEHYESSLKYWGGNSYVSITNLFNVALERGNLEAANHYLNQLKEYKVQYKSNIIKTVYRVSKAKLLKMSPRSINRGKAEEILKQIVEENHEYYITIDALINLCDLLLSELKNIEVIELIDELKFYIGKLINIAEKNHSYLILAETYLLKAKLALFTLNIKETRMSLTEAQRIAEKFKLTRLAIRISNEHDEFLNQLNIWEELKNSSTTIAERIELSGLNKQMDKMIHKKEVEFPKVSDEDPMVLLIISEAGEPLFSQSFSKKWSFENDVFGSFLSAINSFSDEMFSEELDRANFGQYTILMKSVPPFLVCYLFKGQSYLAQHRIKFFTECIQNDNLLWETLKNFYNTSQILQLKDIPTLNPLITDIFLEKNLP
jgi:tetratricopeptide (TPR) repeat protein